MMRIIGPLAAGLTLALFSLTSATQPLRDPTRPPPGAFVVSKAAGKPAVRKSMTLQTVLISPQRRTVVISGRVMSIGDTMDGYRLVEIREAEVVMKGSKGTRTLHLYPAVSKVAATVAKLPEKTKDRE
ncbi:MAG: hypothetical protein JSU95_00745 [Betaproteobacteria bacterium]|nr:MAG: hypothetical protein JSU95_00745 [Betaproteobacteria bacterium]